MQHSTRYVVIDKYCEITGDTPQAVWSRIKNGYWLKGREVLTLSGMKTLIDLEEYERWVESKRSALPPSQLL
ncbi:hypothetical protein R6242_20330 [Iodobacter sp. CM08]|uniref:hypothetical protein n=1 Tax=Iodobacter sp. CM08 TaxID=3085902 RepID=UPI0029816231|nr:hypothetical protein [Iodobacter sp. CM08]MDW5418923.1 hypothetical protein [Iodobacter sp. CM08]